MLEPAARGPRTPAGAAPILHPSRITPLRHFGERNPAYTHKGAARFGLKARRAGGSYGISILEDVVKFRASSPSLRSLDLLMQNLPYHFRMPRQAAPGPAWAVAGHELSPRDAAAQVCDGEPTSRMIRDALSRLLFGYRQGRLGATLSLLTKRQPGLPGAAAGEFVIKRFRLQFQ